MCDGEFAMSASGPDRHHLSHDEDVLGADLEEVGRLLALIEKSSAKLEEDPSLPEDVRALLLQIRCNSLRMRGAIEKEV